MAEDDDIPDLFPGTGPAPSRSPGGPPSRAPAQPAPSGRGPAQSAPSGPAQSASARPAAASVPPSSPLSSQTGPSSFDLASLDDGDAPATASAEDGTDEFEFDLLGATSQSSESLLRGADLLSVPSAKAAPLPSAPSPGPASAAKPAASAGLDWALDAGADDGGLGELDFELGPPAPSARRSSYPAPARQSVAPPQPNVAGHGVAQAQQSVAPAPMSGAFAPNSSGGAASWDLDEALGIAPTIDLTMAVPTAAETSGDGPWPRGQTPTDDELRVDAEEIDAIAGFGPRPRSVLTTPLYFIRVALGKRQLLAQIAADGPEFARVENERDQILATLALELRSSLDDKERFARLYSEVDKYDAMIAQREADLHATDERGSSRLGDLERRLGEAQRELEEKTRQANEERAVHAEADRLARRARAQANRLQIELRNVEDLARQRAAPGAPMPQDLALRFVAVEAEFKAAMASAAAGEADVKARLAPLGHAEDAARRARADLQRIEGEREGYLMAHEGDMLDAGGSLETARRGRIQELSRAACAVLELRGEVAVPVEVRRRIAQADRLVEVAAQKSALHRRALASADETAVATGRFVWLAIGCAFLVSLILAALR